MPEGEAEYVSCQVRVEDGARSRALLSKSQFGAKGFGRVAPGRQQSFMAWSACKLRILLSCRKWTAVKRYFQQKASLKISLIFVTACALLTGLYSGTIHGAETCVEIVDGRWFINGQVVNKGTDSEGLLMNVRMVNATFEDLAKPDFDPNSNTERFLAAISAYAAHGVNAFTLCLQGGMPGYEGAINSAFSEDGSLRADYMKRVERAVRACDANKVVVILGLFYQRQSRLLKNEDALRAGVKNAANWVRQNSFSNVVIEIANEYPHRGFAHPLIRDPKDQAGLIRLAKETAPGLLISASGYGDGKIDAEVAEAADFLLPHWNGTPVHHIPGRVAALKRFGKPIVCNEDDKTGSQAVAAMQASISSGAAYGLMLKERNQTFPFRFQGEADDPVFYAALRAATSESREASSETTRGAVATDPGE